MNNLFIIRSPLQLLNAIEAIYHFNLFDSNNILYIIETNGINNSIQLKKLLNIFKWSEVNLLKSTKKSNFLNYVKIIKKLKRDRYNYLFLGDYGSIHKIIISNIKSNNIYLLDDGVSSITIYNKLITNQSSIKDSFKLIRFLPFGLSIKKVKEINFFTIFNLKKTDNINIIQNNMKKLKNDYDINSFSYLKDIIYLGQPLNSITTQESYVKYIEDTINNNFKNDKIKIFPHRGEDIEETANYLKDKFKNIEIFQNTLPIEKYFLENKIYPNTIVSFISTALFTLKILFPKSKIYYIELNQKDIFENKKDIINPMYKQLANSNIEKIN